MQAAVSASLIETNEGAPTVRAMNALGKLIRAARAAKGLTQTEVGALANVTYAAVGQWESGRTRPSPEHIREIAGPLGMDLDEALRLRAMAETESEPRSPKSAGTNGSRLPLSSVAPDPASPLYSAQLELDVPVHGTAAGGVSGDFALNGETVDWVRRPPGIQRAQRVYAIRVVGNSMSPRYEDNDLVYVSATRTPALGDFVIVELLPEEGSPDVPGYIKRLLRRTPTKIICEQYHPAGEVSFHLARVKKVHRVYTNNELFGV
jgi:phage repressor protein C with HTH and peptisase S24 domain